MHTITSRDGTRIAYDVYGAGEPVILVEGAMCGRHFGATNKLAAELGKHFRVYHYDRRARGDSGPSTEALRRHHPGRGPCHPAGPDPRGEGRGHRPRTRPFLLGRRRPHRRLRPK